MDIATGTGIAIAGIWMLPVASVVSKFVPSVGVWLSLLVAISMTIYLV